MTSPDIPNAGEFLDDRTMVFRRILDIPVERLWTAITEKAEMDQWFMATEMELRVGGRYSFEGGWDGVIGELEPLSRIRFDGKADAFTRFEVEADGEGSRFVLTDRMASGELPPGAADLDAEALQREQPGGAGTHWAGVAGGWHCFVNSLEAHLRGARWKDEYDDYAEMCARYNSLLTRYWDRD